MFKHKEYKKKKAVGMHEINTRRDLLLIVILIPFLPLLCNGHDRLEGNVGKIRKKQVLVLSMSKISIR